LRKAIFSIIYGKEIDQNKCFDECNNSHMKYALKTGADYIVITDFKEGKYIDYPHINYNIMSEKFAAFKRLFLIYDRILYLDGDVFIKKHSPDIFEELKEDCIYMRNEVFNNVQYDEQINNIKCNNWNKTDGHYDFYNAGVILVNKKNDNLFCFNSDEYKRFNDLPFISDQPYINWIIFKYNINIKEIGMEWNAMKYFNQDGYFIHFANTHDRNETIKDWINS
jgi:hypothetical protein